jgi:type III restriction enzyme
MYFGSDQRETVSVMGTPAFMEFVESIQNEGVTFDRVPMGGTGGRKRQDSLVVEVETQSPDKNIEELDIAVPRLTRRYNREFKDLTELEPEHFGQQEASRQIFHARTNPRNPFQDDARFRGRSYVDISIFCRLFQY